MRIKGLLTTGKDLSIQLYSKKSFIYMNEIMIPAGLKVKLLKLTCDEDAVPTVGITRALPVINASTGIPAGPILLIRTLKASAIIENFEVDHDI